jgi:hypothetical protein
MFSLFLNFKKKNANSRHVDECHNETKDRDILKEQVNWAQTPIWKGALHNSGYV